MPRTLAVAATLLLCAPLTAQQPDDGPAALRSAADLFRKAAADPAQLRLASLLFKAAFAERVEMTEDQLAAWAVCRVKLARERFRATGDPAAAAEVGEALKLAPRHAGLQQVGAAVMAEMQAPPASRPREGTEEATPAGEPVAPGRASVPSRGRLANVANFRVTGPDAVAAAAESVRAALFETWSGPAGPWATPCDLVVHPDAKAFAAATGQPPEATGRATVTLADGKVLARRIDLRADDPTLLADALPRELAHVVLADLFPYRAPPAWAEAGMAVLATSAVERDRYRRTLPKSYAAGGLIRVSALLDLTEPPADLATGFHVESASVVDFLVRWKGAKAFKSFLGDAQRYGQPAALQRAYGLADVAALEAAWVRSELAGARAQAP